MKICLLEPYDTGSHAAWLRGYSASSRYEAAPLTMTGQFWKWRMQGGAVTLARLFRERALRADLILASDMLDLGAFLALTRDLTYATPTALYMHENQLTYPLRPGEKRDLHYGFINYTSMLCAQRIFFNSQYHLDSWFDELPRLLKHFPDYNELPTLAALRARSEVLPLGLDLARFNAYRTSPPTPSPRIHGEGDAPVAPSPSCEERHGTARPPLIIWNHRWEYDKNPAEFFQALYTLAAEGYDFRVALLGEHFVGAPPEFEEARARLEGRIVQFGYAESFADYARWLWQGDIVVSTALHDFFGAAVVEAIYCGCWPILPERLAYPQFIPPEHRAACLYRDHEGLLARLRWAIAHVEALRATSLRGAVEQYDWSMMAGVYDARMEELVRYSHPPKNSH